MLSINSTHIQDKMMCRAKSPWNFISISICVLSLYFLADQSVNVQCTRSPPTVVGYSKQQSTPTYIFTWRLERCNPEDIIQYEIQFTGSCSTTPPVTVLARSNETSLSISIGRYSCEEENCYVRMRAELTDGSFTEYSACALINNQFIEHKIFIEQHFQDVCIPIQGVCTSGAVSEFFINGDLTLWPEPTSLLYNVTFSSDSRMYNFCFNNITDDVIFTEFCYQDHSENCSLCSDESGEVIFLSSSEVSINNPTRPYLDTSISTTKMSSLVTNSSMAIPHGMNTKGESQILWIIVGATFISMLCVLTGVILLTVLVILWCKGKSDSIGCSCLRKSNQGNNIYDEPALPDPIYQELTVGLTSEAKIEVMGNDAYIPIALKILESEVDIWRRCWMTALLMASKYSSIACFTVYTLKFYLYLP